LSFGEITSAKELKIEKEFTTEGMLDVGMS
jgi:hypothetical protein